MSCEVYNVTGGADFLAKYGLPAGQSWTLKSQLNQNRWIECQSGCHNPGYNYVCPKCTMARLTSDWRYQRFCLVCAVVLFHPKAAGLKWNIANIPNYFSGLAKQDDGKFLTNLCQRGYAPVSTSTSDHAKGNWLKNQ